MVLRSASILLSLLLLGTAEALGGAPLHLVNAPAADVALHVSADLAQSNAPHEDAAAGLRRVGAPMRAPRLEGLAGSDDDLPQPNECARDNARVHRAEPASGTCPLGCARHGTGQDTFRATASRAPPPARSPR